MSSKPTDPIRLHAVSKRYPSWAGNGRTLRGLVSRSGRGEGRWALRDVSLAVGPGEMVGLVGGNGAGKSTLLRVASGVSQPTKGTTQIATPTAAVLSLGETFAADLSGRENAITAAIVSGFSPREARRRAPEILAYAELEDAAEEPVRTFSEGMKLRLAFSAVTQLRPAALLLDEVMSVGDVSFQNKSRHWVQEARASGTGVLVATHDLEQLAIDADRVLWLDHGHVRQEGPAEEVINAYRNAMLDETYRRTPSDVDHSATRLGSQEVVVENVVLHTDEPGVNGTYAHVGGALTVACTLKAEGPLPSPPIITVSVRDTSGVTCCSITTQRSGLLIPRDFSTLALKLTIDRLDLVPGYYDVEIGAYRDDWSYAYDLHSEGYPLEIRGNGSSEGVLSPPHNWSVA